jgi:hypothetical protein
LLEYCDGTATAETTALLERAPQEDPEYRLRFLEYLNVYQALSSAGERTQHKAEAAPERPARGHLAAFHAGLF